MLNSDIRNRVDGIIKEIFQISKDKERQLDTQLLLTDIYAFPDGFVSEYDSLRGVDALCKMIGDTDYFNHPKLFELIKEVTKKY